MSLRKSLLVLSLLPASLSVRADVVRTIRLLPGTPVESAYVLTGAGTSVDGDARKAEPGGYWVYRVAVTPAARVVLRFRTDDAPVVNVSSSEGKPLISRMDASGEKRAVYATAPPSHPFGGGLRFQIAARAGPVAIHEISLEIRQSDRNGDGIGDAVELMMGVPPGRRATVIPRPARPQTSFQTGSAYSGGIAVPTDAVLAYTNLADRIQSWADAGYVVETIGGFREGADYAKQHPGEVQTDRNGRAVEIGGNSFYMVPTQSRIDIAKRYYEAALAAGSTAICPEEPEFWTRAGYSDAFKQEWQARYGAPWQPPHSSIDARWKSERLKGFLERRQIEAILNDAQQAKPAATRMVAVHSPVTYYQWGLPVPHFGLLTLPALQEMIGQVWTGTARTATRSAGIRMERTFELSYLEYSSLYNLTRSSGKRIRFLMDPVEDDPNRTIEDYRSNYEQTLLASLMFPQVDCFEVMPWPDRIYGRVPAGYATVINSVVGVLADLWRYPNGQFDAGSEGIGTFVSDSMGWQRGDPAESDYDGFYGLCLPLVLHGIPVQVLSLDRVAEPGYLSRVKSLLVSYDFLKPTDAAQNRALADWVRHGGSLIVVGGSDAYNDLADSWWRRAGHASPVEDVFAQLGLDTRVLTPRPGLPPSSDVESTIKPVLHADADVHDGRNRRHYAIDLTPYARESGSALVRFEDVSPQDGWGPALYAAELRIGSRLAASFRTGSELETRFLAEENNSRFNGDARYADGGASWSYRFDNLPRDTQVTITLDLANGFLVSAGTAGPRPPVMETRDTSFGPTVTRMRVPHQYPITRYSLPSAATPLYTLAGESDPVVWEARVGDGTVMVAGIAPGYLTWTAQTSRWLRALTQRAFEKTGRKYEERSAFVVRRGPVAGIRTLGRSYTADGRWVNLLSPTLALVEDPEIPARSQALLMDAGPEKGGPRLLAVSGRLRAKAESGAATGFLVQAPDKTEGAARVWTGKRRFLGARAWTTLGEPIEINAFPDGDSVLLRYGNVPEGVVVRVGWQ